MHDIVCIGILVADTVVRTVKKMPETGKLGLLDSISLYSGGCALNAAIDLAKLGADAAICGMMGNDGFGNYLESEMKKYNIDTLGIVKNEECGTSASVVLVDANGERSFLHSLGANGVFSANDVNFNVIDNSSIVFVAGCMLMPSFDGADCAKVLQYAKKKRKITALDTAWDDRGLWMKTLGVCMKHIDYFLPSIAEAERLSGKTDPSDMADIFFEMGVGAVVIKLGKEGCYMQRSQGGKGIYIPTYNKYKPVDTTGAGDSFCAGFLYGLSHGLNIEECCRLGNAVGTLCILSAGSSTGIRSYKETVAFMEENKE